MTAARWARLSCVRLPLLPAGVGFVLVIGGAIAAVAPFDVAFATATRGSAPARVVLFCVLALLGGLAAGGLLRPERSDGSV